MRIVVPVYKKTHWTLRPFSILFNKYWLINGGKVNIDVMCYSKPDFDLPNNFNICQIDKIDYPRHLWADGLLQYLYRVDDNEILIMLEDYWLVRKVDAEGVLVLGNLVKDNILRVDLTTDRLYAGGMRDIGYIGHYDIIEARESPYQMSLQAGIWNKSLLIDVIEKMTPGKRSSWDVELEGTGIVNAEPDKYRVVGTRQNPVRYINGINDATGIIKTMIGVSEEDSNMMMKYIKEHNGE